MNNFKFSQNSRCRCHRLLTSYAAIFLFMLISSILLSSILAFSEVPFSQTVSAGEEAEFGCQYMGAFSIVWTVNGSMNYPPGVSSENRQTDDVIASILTITALPEYNGTLVQCVATIINGTSPTFNFSPTAILVVISNTPAPITSPPTTTSPLSPSGVFLATPLSQNVTIGTTVLFHCQHETGSVLWRINNSRFDDFPAASINSNNIFHTLTITEPSLQYNGTKIECIAILGSEQTKSPPATLLLQGQLDDVTNISRDSSTISWNPPFSLNLTNVEPDIVYCVDVYNITCGGRELLISDCDVTETSYTSDVIAPDGYIYEYIVTPRSNVEGAINGTPSQPVRDRFPPVSRHSSQVSVINTTTVTYKVLFTINVTEQNFSVPSSFTLSLDALDGLGDMDSVDTGTSRVGEVLTLDVPAGLPRHRLWNLIITPYRCQNGKLSVLGDAELSTHDIQNISVTSPQPGEVRVTGDFIDGSTATGLLIIIYSADIIEYQLVEGRVKLEAVMSGLHGGDYQVSVFVVEENGLPFSRAASTPKQIVTSSAVVNADNTSSPGFPNFIIENWESLGMMLLVLLCVHAEVMKYSIEYKILPNSTGVTIVCEFLDTNSITSTKSCIVVVHQRVYQLYSSGLLNIESYIFTRDGDTASGFIEGLNLEEHQIGVIGGKRKVPPESNAGLPSCSRASLVCVGSITATVVAGFVLTVIVVITCIILGKRNRTHNENTGQESSVAGVQMKRCEAYEVTTLARKKSTMEPNLAYEQVCIV